MANLLDLFIPYPDLNWLHYIYMIFTMISAILWSGVFSSIILVRRAEQVTVDEPDNQEYRAELIRQALKEEKQAWKEEPHGLKENFIRYENYDITKPKDRPSFAKAFHDDF